MHQFQRPHGQLNGEEYIDAKIEDYETACWLVEQILLKTLSNYGSKPRELLSGIFDMVKKLLTEEQKPLQEITFTRSDIAESMKWTPRQVNTHIKELEEFEAIKVMSGSQGKGYKYRLIRDSDQVVSSGLLKPEELKKKWEETNNHAEHYA